MTIDLLMGFASLMIGFTLAGFSAPLAHFMKEGDERYREEHPWVQAYEPQVGWLATDSGRWWILRSWLLLFAMGFAVIGGLLVARGAF